MARSRRRRREEDFDKETEWLAAETAKLKLDLRGLVLSIPRAIIALTRRQERRPDGDWPGGQVGPGGQVWPEDRVAPDGTPKKRPPLM